MVYIYILVAEKLIKVLLGQFRIFWQKGLPTTYDS